MREPVADAPLSLGRPDGGEVAAGVSGGVAAELGSATGEWAAGRRATRALAIGLVAWDAILPAALLMTTAGLQDTIAAPWNGATAAGSSWVALMLAALSPLGLAAVGGYRHRRRRAESRIVLAVRLLALGLALSWTVTVVAAWAGWPLDPAQVLVLPAGLAAGWLLGRWACDRHPLATRDRVLLIGSGPVAQRVLTLTARHHDRRLDVVGRLDDEPLPMADDAPPLLGGIGDLRAVLAGRSIDRVIVAFPRGRDEELLDMLRECSATGIQVDVVPRFFDLVGPSSRSYSLGGITLVEVPPRGLTTAQRLLKRTADVAGSLLLIGVLAVPALVVAAAIAVVDGRPVIFRQTRIGLGGRRFRILKFRTMHREGDRAGVARAVALADEDEGDLGDAGAIGAVVRGLKADDPARLTPLGRFLRRSSLDELPQLGNVLVGHMSLVGPRPLRPFEHRTLADWQHARLELRPGLTGLWQVLGRSSVDWDERIQLDYSYVAHWSLLLDMRILARTLPAVLRRDGAL